MTQTTQPETPQVAPAPNTRPHPTRTYVTMAIVITVAIAAATWWMGKTQGWDSIGTGGANAQYIPRVGEVAPELFTVSENNEPMLLSRLRGQPVWINFWGSWCAPCRSEMPEISRAYDTLAPEGLNIISIAMREEPEQAITYRNTAGAHFPVYVDPAYLSQFVDREKDPEVAALMDSVQSRWQINNFPTHIFIDADGVVRKVVIAQMTYDEAVANGRSVMDSTGTPVAIVPGRNE